MSLRSSPKSTKYPCNWQNSQPRKPRCRPDTPNNTHRQQCFNNGPRSRHLQNPSPSFASTFHHIHSRRPLSISIPLFCCIGRAANNNSIVLNPALALEITAPFLNALSYPLPLNDPSG